MWDIERQPELTAWMTVGAWAKPDNNWLKHHLFYYLLKMMNAKSTLEIGIGRGNGTYIFGLHAKEIGGRHATIDVAPNCISRAEQIKARFDLPVDIFHGDSKMLVWRRYCNLIYVDGGHHKDQVLGDIANFGKWVKQGGLMVFDDWGKKHHGVTEALVEAFDPEVWEQITLPFAWWTIWRKR